MKDTERGRNKDDSMISIYLLKFKLKPIRGVSLSWFQYKDIKLLKDTCISKEKVHHIQTDTCIFWGSCFIQC